MIVLPEYSIFWRDVSGQYIKISILSDNSFSTSFFILRNMNGFRIKCNLDKCSKIKIFNNHMESINIYIYFDKKIFIFFK